MHSLFEIQHLSYAYHTMQGETPALSDITFTVNSGDFVAIVGPSGCGKSTLFKSAGRMLTPESGTLLLNGTPLTAEQPAPHRIYAAAGLSAGMAQHLEKCTAWSGNPP